MCARYRRITVRYNEECDTRECRKGRYDKWYERCEEKMRNVLGSENDEVYKN